jgi:hypothetical protein
MLLPFDAELMDIAGMVGVCRHLFQAREPLKADSQGHGLCVLTCSCFQLGLLLPYPDAIASTGHYNPRYSGKVYWLEMAPLVHG